MFGRVAINESMVHVYQVVRCNIRITICKKYVTQRQ